MSAIGGKADVRELPAGCPLIARSGHSALQITSHFPDAGRRSTCATPVIWRRETRAAMRRSVGRWNNMKDKRTTRLVLFALCAAASCAPSAPGDPFCLDEDCNICSGWDCSNSFVNESHPRPQSTASRDAVTQCYQGIDEYTRDLAEGHFEPLARIGVLSWGPARVWTYQESQARELMVSDIEDCMDQQGWIYCCRGYDCELDFSRSGSGRWMCLRKPETQYP